MLYNIAVKNHYITKILHHIFAAQKLWSIDSNETELDGKNNNNNVR